MNVVVNWDTDNVPATELGLPVVVSVPNEIDIDDIADYLSDEYGYCVNSFFVQ